MRYLIRSTRKLDLLDTTEIQDALVGVPCSAADGPERPWAQLVDDGELEDIKKLLDQLGTATQQISGGSIPDEWELPERLLVMSARRALELDQSFTRAHGLTKIAVCPRGSSALRHRLAKLGFDHVVQRPTDPLALRLLVRSAVYRGADDRTEPRRPVGCEVSWRVRWRSRPATLVELSGSGCTLIGDTPARPGERLTVRVPAEITGGEPLALRGSAVRWEPSEKGIRSTAVVFDCLPPELWRRLSELVARLRLGPPSLAA